MKERHHHHVGAVKASDAAKVNPAEDYGRHHHRPRTISISQQQQSGGNGFAYACMLLYQLIMSVWAVFGTKALGNVQVPVVSFLLARHFLASILLFGLGAFKYGLDAMVPDTEDNTKLFVAGLLAQYGSPVFYLYGLQFVPATIGSIFDGPCIPLIVYILALMVRVERLPVAWRSRVGVVVALLCSSGGAALLILASASSGSGEAAGETPDFGLGDDEVLEFQDVLPTPTESAEDQMFTVAIVALFLEALCLSASLIIQKPLTVKYTKQRQNPLAFAFWIAFAGFVGVAAQVALYEEGGILFAANLLIENCQQDSNFFVALIYNAVAISVINTLCAAFANAKLPSSIVALGACIQPVLTLMLDVIFFGASFTISHFLSLCLVAFGIHLFTKHSTAPVPVSIEKQLKEKRSDLKQIP